MSNCATQISITEHCRDATSMLGQHARLCPNIKAALDYQLPSYKCDSKSKDL